MDIKQYYFNENEKPLDRLPADGGFAGIFRTIACVGDSLSSGEFESVVNDGNPGYHDMFEYSWGQYLGRLIGSKVYNFSRGGMTAEEYCRSFAEANRFWEKSKKADCYIVALGVNDIINAQRPVGCLSDIDFHDPEKSAKTFAGWYGKLILRYKAILFPCRDPEERRSVSRQLRRGTDSLSVSAGRYA